MTGILLISQYKNWNNWLFNGIYDYSFDKHSSTLSFSYVVHGNYTWCHQIFCSLELWGYVMTFLSQNISPLYSLMPFLLPWLYSKTQIPNVSWLYCSYHMKKTGPNICSALLIYFFLSHIMSFSYCHDTIYRHWNLLILWHLQIKMGRT